MNGGYRFLVIWYGLYQAGHLAVNLLYFLGAIPFPPAPASGAWDAQIRPFFHAMGATDLLVSVLSLAFVISFLRGGDVLPLGLVSTAASLYSAAIFTYGCAANGTWKSNFAEQAAGNALFLPVVLLFALTWLRLQRVAASRPSPVSKSTEGR